MSRPTDPSSPSPDELPLSAEVRVDGACQRFEAEWQAGGRPRPADFLAGTAGTEYAVLLRELILLDVSYRLRLGETPRPEDYRPRGPDSAPGWLAGLFAVPPEPPVAGPDERAAGGVIAGRYTLVGKAGEGGMGEVWAAEQDEPVKRRVALKFVKAGLDSRAVSARFAAERQALALMDHPHIAKVLDGGLTAAGRPFFVMEWVDGQPLTRFCDERKLTPRQRLELFVPVCRAVQHAHQKGVVHRDIKPSNVLVTLVNGRPAPKVIDFGVAKAVGGKLSDESPATQLGSLVGTLEYMPPEQAGGEDVDTRADVYSLGVILYELLTGLRPLDAGHLRAAGLAEMIRAIREAEPSRPSTRLSADESRRSLAALRRTEPRKLTALLRGELDWVVMRCLEKQRDRRYETVGGLARDLECYLAHEPVSARPPSRWYLARKFARRHRGLVSAAAVVLLALSGGVVGTSVGLARAEAARAAEAAQRRQAQAREAEAAAVLKFLEDRVLAAGRPEGLEGGLGADIRLMDAVRAALPHVGPSFAGQPLIEARLRATLGRSFLVLGDVPAAEQQYAAARSLYTGRLGPDHPDALTSAAGLAQSYQALGRRPEALRLNEETLALRKVRLGPDHPDTLTSMNNLAVAHDALRHFHEALELREQTLSLRKARLGPDHPDTLQSMFALSVSYTRLGRHREALELAEKTFALRRATLGPDNPQTLRSMHQVANGYQVTGRRQEAVKLQEETLARQRAKIGPDHPDTLQTMHALSRAYAALDRYPEAIELCEATLALQRKKLSPDHPSTLLSMRTLALQYTAVGRHADAYRLNAEAWAARKATVGPDHPYTLQTAWRYADSLVRLGRGAEAIPLIDDCYRRAPGQAVDPRLLPEVLRLRLRHFAGRMDAAGCRTTADMWERLGRADAEDWFTAAVMRAAASGLYAAARQPDEAKADADRAVSWLTKAVAAGFRDRARLEAEADLAAVRGREDFRKLLESLQPTPPGR